jgi:hypothetical protein
LAGCWAGQQRLEETGLAGSVNAKEEPVTTFIKIVFTSLALVLAATGGVVFGAGAMAADAATLEPAAVIRDEREYELLAEEDAEDDLQRGGDASRSRDRSRDMTTRDASRSRDRSRDRTRGAVNVPDRSNSRDLSRDRTGDHDTPDISRSLSRSRDNTTGVAGPTNTNTNTGGRATNANTDTNRNTNSAAGGGGGGGGGTDTGRGGGGTDSGGT